MLRQQQQQWQVPIVELNVDCLPAISLIHKTFETDGKWNWNCRRTYSFILNVLLCMSKRAKANQNQTKSIRFKVRSSPFNCIFKSLKCFETVLELIQEYSRHKNLGDIILQFNCSFFFEEEEDYWNLTKAFGNCTDNDFESASNRLWNGRVCRFVLGWFLKGSLEFLENDLQFASGTKRDPELILNGQTRAVNELKYGYHLGGCRRNVKEWNGFLLIQLLVFTASYMKPMRKKWTPVNCVPRLVD